MKLIQTKETAIKIFQRSRWQNGILCPKCVVYESVERHSKSRIGFQKYRCICGHVFSDTSGTVLHRRRIDVRHFLIALYELSQTKGITSVELGKKLGVRQKKAWILLMLLRNQCRDLIKPYYTLTMRGVVETDEAYYGKGDNSQMMQGILQRGQHAIVIPINDRTEETLKGNVKKHVRKHSYIMTDTASAYGGLCCSGYTHFTLNHSKDEYSKGNGIHENTQEGFWGNQKKILYGIHHGVSKKYLFNYVSEFVLKYNLRQAKFTFPTFNLLIADAVAVTYQTLNPSNWHATADTVTDEDFAQLDPTAYSYYTKIPNVDTNNVRFKSTLYPQINTLGEFVTYLKTIKPIDRVNTIRAVVGKMRYTITERTEAAFKKFHNNQLPEKDFLELVLNSNELENPGDGDCDVQNSLFALFARYAGIPTKLDFVFTTNNIGHASASIFIPKIGWILSDTMGERSLIERVGYHDNAIDDRQATDTESNEKLAVKKLIDAMRHRTEFNARKCYEV